MKTHLTAPEAAAELGVTLATLYAYVSRGLIRSTAQPGSRAKLYRADDVRALKGRSGGETPAATAAPAIETAMTLIAGDRLSYRGVDAERLAETARLEAVASLLWDATEDPFRAAECFETVPPLPGGGLVERLLVGLARAAEADLAGYAASPDAIARTGARILRQMTRSACGRDPFPEPIHTTLALGWSRPGAADVIRAALVLTADHEMAASTLAVRVTASTGASPWRAVTAGLACLDGPRHGGVTTRVAALFDAVEAAGGDADRVVAERLRAGETIAGFGHPLYVTADPRCRGLMAAARAGGADLSTADRLVAAGARLLGAFPTLDFGLVAACRATGLPRDAPLALFAIGRTAGWIGHVIEESAAGRLIRLRAVYTGRAPG